MIITTDMSTNGGFIRDRLIPGLLTVVGIWLLSLSAHTLVKVVRENS